jgi:hypothetical protein
MDTVRDTFHFLSRWGWLIGLSLQLIGAVIVAKAAYVSPQQAVSLGVSRWAGTTFEDKVQLPAVQNLLNQSRAARRGLLFVILGTFVQIPAAWPKS